MCVPFLNEEGDEQWKVSQVCSSLPYKIVADHGISTIKSAQSDTTDQNVLGSSSSIPNQAADRGCVTI